MVKKQTHTKQTEFSFIEIVSMLLMIVFMVLLTTSSLFAQKDMVKYKYPNFHTTNNLSCDGHLKCTENINRDCSKECLNCDPSVKVLFTVINNSPKVISTYSPNWTILVAREIKDLKLNEPFKMGNHAFEIIGGDTTNFTYITLDVDGNYHNYKKYDTFSPVKGVKVTCANTTIRSDPYYDFQGKFILEVTQ